MSHYRIVIQRVDDTQPERVTELDRIEVPHLDARSLQQETALDHLETQTLAQGQEVMRRLLVRHWEGWSSNWWPATGSFFPLSPVKGDGHDPLKVASRLGILHLPRQVLERTDGGGHLLPGNDLLPEHEGMVITRGLREWACLLPLDVGTETAQRLLGWITQEPGVLSASEVRCLVRERTREAALQAARRVDPGATEAQITTPTQPGLLVQIMTSGPEGRMPMMTLHAGGGGVNVGANRVRLRPEDGGVPPPP